MALATIQSRRLASRLTPPAPALNPSRLPSAKSSRFGRRYRFSRGERVNAVLRIDHRFNGARAYAVPGGTIVLWGTVFDDNDSRLAAESASHVRSVMRVENHLTTMTAQWMAQQVLINNALVRVGPLQNVSARVIGNQAYLWAEVNSESDKAWAARAASSVANLQVENLVRVVPGPLFSLARWLRSHEDPALVSVIA